MELICCEIHVAWSTLVPNQIGILSLPTYIFPQLGILLLPFMREYVSVTQLELSLSFADLDEIILATHVLQFTFNSSEGSFQYPICHFPTSKLTASALTDIYWECIAALLHNGFDAHMGVCDGGQANRSMIMMHFESEEDAIKHKFITRNPYNGKPHVFMMDPSVSLIIDLDFDISIFAMQGVHSLFKVTTRNA